ncbi:MAG: hypothetical protein PHY05_11175 [Methanothrix sp.]|nr:hypothetical protein [Methanothrix sp.]
MRLSIDDKADFVYYQSKFNKEKIAAIEDSARNAARRINSNADLNTARELIGIENAANIIAESQKEASYIIDKSIQAGTSKIIDNQNKNTINIINSLEDLRALFDVKLSGIIFLLEDQRDLMKEILRVLQLPLTTQAKELKERAQNAFGKGTISDDVVERARWFDNAIRDFEKSKEYNPYDFTIYLALGHIFLNEKNEDTKALKNFKDAAFYAKDYPYYKSTSLLYAGITNYKLGLYLEAYDITSEAIKLYPKLSEAYYRCAQYCSKLNRYDEAINYLRTAIDADRGYSLKTLAEEDFAPMSDKFKDLMQDLTREEKSKANTEIKNSSNLINIFDTIGIPSNIKENLKEAINLKNAGTYLNYRDAKYKAKASQKALVDSLIYTLSIQLSDTEGQFKNLQSKNLKCDFERISSLLNKYKNTTLISFPFAILGSGLIYRLIYDDFPSSLSFFLKLLVVSLPTPFIELFTLLFILSPIAIPIFIYSLSKYIILLPQSVSYKKIESLNDKKLESLRSTIANVSQNIAKIKSEKEKLNIENKAENLNLINYEKYLRKAYG